MRITSENTFETALVQTLIEQGGYTKNFRSRMANISYILKSQDILSYRLFQRYFELSFILMILAVW
ncbi:MAG: hypothetical protein ACK4UP_09545 [Spirosomataceae bacterium]